jgi:hypothetical protein
MFWRLLTNEKLYHMILVIIIVSREKTMLSNVLRSGWGVVLPGIVLTGLAFSDLSLIVWKMLIVTGLLVTSAMIWHKQLRHFVLLPSCVALISVILVIMMSLK